MDNNEIMAVNNGATSTLLLQNDGGALNIGGNTDITGTLDVSDDVTANQFNSVRSVASNDVFLSQVSGDSVNRFLIEADGGHFWGSGGASRDTNLYRGGVNSEFISLGAEHKAGHAENVAPQRIEPRFRTRRPATGDTCRHGGLLWFLPCCR